MFGSKGFMDKRQNWRLAVAVCSSEAITCGKNESNFRNAFTRGVGGLAEMAFQTLENKGAWRYPVEEGAPLTRGLKLKIPVFWQVVWR